MKKAFAKDLVKKRREYLRKKATGNSMMGIGYAATLVFGGMAVIFTLVFLSSLLLDWKHFDWQYFGVSLLIWFVFLLVTGGMTFVSYKIAVAFEKKAKSLLYVPPVAEQIAALPAEAILVRGSEQPTASPKQLLRAAHAGTVDSAQELLRPNSEPSAWEPERQTVTARS